MHRIFSLGVRPGKGVHILPSPLALDSVSLTLAPAWIMVNASRFLFATYLQSVISDTGEKRTLISANTG